MSLIAIPSFENLNCIDSFLTFHSNVYAGNTHKQRNLIHYKIYANKEYTYFQVNATCVIEQTIVKGRPELTHLKTFKSKFENKDAIITIYAHIDNANECIEFEGTTASNIMVRGCVSSSGISHPAKKSNGIGTTSFTQLVKYVKLHAPGNYRVKNLTLGSTDENIQEDEFGNKIDNKIRRNKFYENYGFIISNDGNNAHIDNVDKLKEVKSKRCKRISFDNFIEYFKKHAQTSIEDKKELTKRIKINEELIKTKNEYYEEKYTVIKYASFAIFFLLIILYIKW